jgi:hypothetical protein
MTNPWFILVLWASVCFATHKLYHFRIIRWVIYITSVLFILGKLWLSVGCSFGSATTLQALGDATTLGKTLEIYASKHKGRYPEKLDDLVGNFLEELPTHSEKLIYSKPDENASPHTPILTVEISRDRAIYYKDQTVDFEEIPLTPFQEFMDEYSGVIYCCLFLLFLYGIDFGLRKRNQKSPA